MIEQLVKFWFQKTGKDYLVPFLNGLIHIGRPGKVLFPTELIEQGLSLMLSGLNNTMAFQSNPDWVWPYWYERQRDPQSPMFIPTGMNMVTSNLVLRNWTSIGLWGSDEESIVDPVGMLSLKPFGCSVFPYIRYQGNNYIPPLMASGVHQHLLQDTWPAVVTEYHCLQAVRWSNTARSIQVDGQELVAYTHEIENNLDKAIQLTFGITIRPYNALSVSHINRIKFRDGLWRVNHEPTLWMIEPPQWVGVSDRNSMDPLLMGRTKDVRAHSSRSGIAAGYAEYDICLEPHEKRIIETIGTIRIQNKTIGQRFEKPSYTIIQESKINVQTEWEKQSQQGMQIRIPDKKWQQAFQAIRNRMYVFDDGDHFSPGTFLYHQHWIRDSAFIGMAYASMGWTELLKSKAYGLLKMQTLDGFFRSQNGEWDSNGEAIYSLVNYAVSSGDIACLKDFWPAILKGCRWIENRRKETLGKPSPHYGLLPSGFSAEHFGPNDHYYWDNFWSLAGIKEALWIAETQGAPDKKWIQDLYDSYLDDVHKAIKWSVSKNPDRGLPSSPYRRVDCSAIGNMVALSPLDLFSADTPWISLTAQTLAKECLQQGMFFQNIIHTGMNAYLTLQLARAFLWMNNPQWQSLVQSVLDHASPTWTWPEAIHPGSLGGCMGDGDHGWAAAELLSFTAQLMAHTQNEELILGLSIPKSWYHADNSIGVKNCVTRAGTVSWEVQCAGNIATLQWKIERNRLQRKYPAYFQLPVQQGLAQPYLTDHKKSQNLLRLSTDVGCTTIRI